VSESTSCYPSLSVDTMGTGIVSQAGAVMLLRTAEKTGLGGVLCAALAPWRKPLATHDPGKILLDLGRRGHRPGDEADGPAPAGPTRRTHSPRIDLRPGHGSGILRLVLVDDEPVRRGAGRRHDSVLRARLHPGTQAPHRAERGVGRGSGLHAGDHRLGGGDRHGAVARGRHVRHHLLLDAAAHLDPLCAHPVARADYPSARRHRRP